MISKSAEASARRAPAYPHSDLSALPPDVAFLPRYASLGRDVLEAAAREARRLGVPAGEVLIARRSISASLYYQCLAWHLGCPFTLGWPSLEDATAVGEALRSGRARLADDARWLVAPRGPDVFTLLAARVHVPRRLNEFVVTTPAHFADVVCHRLRDRVTGCATEALPFLAPHLSARRRIGWPLGATFVAMALAAALGVACGVHGVFDAFGFVFLASIVDRLAVSAAGLREPALSQGTPPGAGIADAALPTYSVLVPLYDEACMVGGLIESLAALDYPAAKIEILCLLESDDHATVAAIRAAGLRPNMRVVVAPAGAPRTKPRALNIGLLQACGELVTIFDAEDRPEPDQLRKAAACFALADEDLGCVQARLAIRRRRGSILEALFAMEYAALFDVFNVGVARLRLPMALGGTSNHFRRSVLRSVGAWDAWNVTEDADLGIRLARFGWQTQTIASTTFEDAPRSWAIWLKQRRRWTKGWMQTLVVALRDPAFARDCGWLHTLHLALLMTNLVTSTLATPVFAAIVVWSLAVHGLPRMGDTLAMVEAALGGSVLALGVGSLLFQHACGLRKRGLTRLMPVLPLILLYTLLVSLAGWLGFAELLRDPFHWHKTDHGEVASRVSRSWHAAPRRRRTAPRPRRRG